jgi:hypothetical protein
MQIHHIHHHGGGGDTGRHKHPHQHLYSHGDSIANTLPGHRGHIEAKDSEPLYVDDSFAIEPPVRKKPQIVLLFMYSEIEICFTYVLIP